MLSLYFTEEETKCCDFDNGLCDGFQSVFTEYPGYVEWENTPITGGNYDLVFYGPKFRFSSKKAKGYVSIKTKKKEKAERIFSSVNVNNLFSTFSRTCIVYQPGPGEHSGLPTD